MPRSVPQGKLGQWRASGISGRLTQRGWWRTDAVMKITEISALRIAVAIACLVPLSAGAAGMIAGAAMLGGGGHDLDSHYRYLSGLLFGVGIGFVTTIPGLPAGRGRFRLLTGIVAAGGLGRLLGLAMGITPSWPMLAALVMELGVTPALALWRERVDRRAAAL